jgi:hypothetical protein
MAQWGCGGSAGDVVTRFIDVVAHKDVTPRYAQYGDVVAQLGMWWLSLDEIAQ